MPALEVERRSRGGAPAPVTHVMRPDDPESTRILQRMGPVSLGVSMPRNWVEANRLQVGSPVQLRISADGSVRIRSSTTPPVWDRRFRIEVTPGMLPEHLFRCLLGAYLAGAAEFEVFQRDGVTPDSRGVVRTFARRTIQPEVISEDGETLELQDVSDASPVPLPKLLVRMGQLVVAMQVDAAQSWVRLPVGTPTSWEARDDEVDRQAWFIERSAVRLLDGAAPLDRTMETGIGPLGCWTVARSLERIADHAVRMGESGARLGESHVPRSHLVSLQQFHGQAVRHLTAVLEALAEESGSRANELLDTGEALHEVARTLSERLFPSAGSSAQLPPSTAIALGRILESIDRTTAYAQDIAQVALDRALPFPRSTVVRPDPPTAGKSRATKESNRTQGGKEKK